MGKYGIEDNHLEFKSNYTKKALNVIDSFLNTDGGKVLFSVNDNGDPIPSNDKELNDLELQVTNALYDSIKPDPSIYLNVQKENNEVISVDIEEGENKPYYLSSKGLNSKGVFVRKGSGTYPATEEEIKMMIKESDGINFEDLRSPIQNLTFEQAKSYFQNKDLNFEAGLKSLGLIQLETNLYTNLALLLSDQNPFTIKVATFSDSFMTKFLTRREFSGSILKQIEEVLDFLSIVNKNTFSIEKQYRVEKPDFPVFSIREAVINAVIHRDYNFNGPILIKLNQEKLDISSFGSLVKGLDLEDIMSGIHLPRNPKLSNIFYRLELIEAYGTGITRIFSEYVDSQKKPEINLTPNIFILTLPNQNYQNTISSKNQLKEETESETINLTPSQIKILTILEEPEIISSKELLEKSKLKQSTFYKALNDLETNQLIERKNKNSKNRIVMLTKEGKIVLNTL